MANISTASDWKLAASALNSQVTDIKNQQSFIERQIQVFKDQQNQITAATVNAVPGSVQQNAADQLYQGLSAEIERLTNQKNQLEQQGLSIESQIQNAEVQASIANSGPPNVQMNTPPANALYGDNTDVSLPQSEPNVANIKTIQSNSINLSDFDTGSKSQAVIDAEQDPFVKSQMEAAQQDVQYPTSQDVIDAEQDPFVKSQMEAAQKEWGDSEDPNEAVLRSIDDQILDQANNQSDWGYPELSPEEELNRELSDPSVIINDDGSKLVRGINGEWIAYDTEGEIYEKGSAVESVYRDANSADWRVKLKLADRAGYLYKVAEKDDILFPLKSTDGVIFPYTPQINFSYEANYEASDLTHTNYKFYQYRNSEASSIQITADFTAQDIEEADYVLAVIHFFKSVTKMFYGQDKNPTRGIPPPLCFLVGLGPQQFNNHPLVVKTFQYSLPNDVDYIRTSYKNANGIEMDPYKYKPNVNVPGLNRLFSSNLQPGGGATPPKFTSLANKQSTYIPTKIQINITCLPIVTRDDISRNFSLEEYARGRGRLRGIW